MSKRLEAWLHDPPHRIRLRFLQVAFLAAAAVLPVSCMIGGRATVQGDGSTVGARVFMDGKEVGRMRASPGKLPRFPASTLPAASRVGVPDTTWFDPGPGYARCEFRAGYGERVLRVVSTDGRTLEARVRVDGGAEIRVSFDLMATQAFALSP